MRTTIYFILAFLCMSLGWACTSENDEPLLGRSRQAPLNPQDSTIIMELYANFHPNVISDPNSIWVMWNPDCWKGIDLEYDQEMGYRYVCGITMAGIPDSIPKSLGKLTHLRHLHLDGIPNEPVLLPKEVFDCPLVSLYLAHSQSSADEDPSDNAVTLPEEIINVKTSLETLTIYCTNLSELPEEFAQMYDLKECSITLCNLHGKVPDYFGEFRGRVDLSKNSYSEYNWELVALGKNIPWCQFNRISNPIPEYIKNNFKLSLTEKFKYNIIWI